MNTHIPHLDSIINILLRLFYHKTVIFSVSSLTYFVKIYCHIFSVETILNDFLKCLNSISNSLLMQKNTIAFYIVTVFGGIAT